MAPQSILETQRSVTGIPGGRIGSLKLSGIVVAKDGGAPCLLMVCAFGDGVAGERG